MIGARRLAKERRGQLGALLYGLLRRDLAGLATTGAAAAGRVEDALLCLERGMPLPDLAGLPPAVSWALKAFAATLRNAYLPHWWLDRWLDANWRALAWLGPPVCVEEGLTTRQDCRNAIWALLEEHPRGPELEALLMRVRLMERQAFPAEAEEEDATPSAQPPERPAAIAADVDRLRGFASRPTSSRLPPRNRRR